MSTDFRGYLKGAKISPRKVRLVADMLRGKNVQDALDSLRFTNKKAAPILSKLINSVISSASEKATVDVDGLVVNELYVDEGPMQKRFLPRAQGRATQIKKRTSHITLKLREI